MIKCVKKGKRIVKIRTSLFITKKNIIINYIIQQECKILNNLIL